MWLADPDAAGCLGEDEGEAAGVVLLHPGVADLPTEFLNITEIFFYFLLYLFFIFLPLPPLRGQPTRSYHANPAGSPTRNDLSLQVGEMPDLNPGLQVLQSGAPPLSHHIPHKKICKYCLNLNC